MIRQHDNGIDDEGIASARSRHRIAQGVDTIDQQGVSTFKKVDREKPAPSRDKCATVIWHLCRLAIFPVAQYTRPVMPRRFWEWRVTASPNPSYRQVVMVPVRPVGRNSVAYSAIFRLASAGYG